MATIPRLGGGGGQHFRDRWARSDRRRHGCIRDRAAALRLEGGACKGQRAAPAPNDRVAQGRRCLEDRPRASLLPAGAVVKEQRGRTARSTTMSKMHSVGHFEMPYDDRERMAKFDQDAFGWQTRMLGEEMGNYVIATTTETDESGPKKPGAINGGFFARKPDWPGQHPSLVIAVDDIQAAMKKVAEAGGKVLGEPIEIPGIGQYVSFVDTEDNWVSMLQPIPRG